MPGVLFQDYETLFKCGDKMFCYRSFQLLFQRTKLRRVKKFPQRDIQTVTQLFDGHNGDIPAAMSEHAVYGGGGDSCAVGQGVWLQSPFPAQLFETEYHHIFHLHTITPLGNSMKFYASAYTQSRI